jgi:DNA-binding transcriptional LysR family regulator
MASDPLVVAAGTSHRWANRRKVDFAELAEESWVLPRADSWNYICIADAFRNRGLRGPKISMWSNDASVRTHLVAKGLFVTAIGKLNAEWCGMKVLPIDLAIQPWPVVIATLKGRTLSPVGRGTPHLCLPAPGARAAANSSGTDRIFGRAVPEGFGDSGPLIASARLAVGAK